MNGRELKNAAYGHIARMGKALSSGPRLEILDLLCQGPRTVEDVAGEVGQSVANTSHHLRSLASAELVLSERRGSHVRYRVASPLVMSLFARLRGLADLRLSELAELRRDFVAGVEDLEAIAVDELEDWAARADVTLLDVRPVSEYLAGHVPGAVSMPVDELAVRIDELPMDGEIVAYCRGPYCVMAKAAVRVLLDTGRRARIADVNVADWVARGNDVEVAS